MSDPANAEAQPVPAIENEKTLCSCGKMISKKNLAVHQKTSIHLKAVQPKDEKKEEGGGKLKAVIEQMNEKLDYITDLLDDLADELLMDEDEEEQNEAPQTN